MLTLSFGRYSKIGTQSNAYRYQLVKLFDLRFDWFSCVAILCFCLPCLFIHPIVIGFLLGIFQLMLGYFQTNLCSQLEGKMYISSRHPIWLYILCAVQNKMFVMFEKNFLLLIRIIDPCWFFQIGPKTTRRRMMETERNTAGWKTWNEARLSANNRQQWRNDVADLCDFWRRGKDVFKHLSLSVVWHLAPVIPNIWKISILKKHLTNRIWMMQLTLTLTQGQPRSKVKF